MNALFDAILPDRHLKGNRLSILYKAARALHLHEIRKFGQTRIYIQDIFIWIQRTECRIYLLRLIVTRIFVHVVHSQVSSISPHLLRDKENIF